MYMQIQIQMQKAEKYFPVFQIFSILIVSLLIQF